jgi:hypothetical protein
MSHNSRTFTRLISPLLLFMGCASYSRLLGEPPDLDVQATRLAKEVHGKGWIVYTGPSENGDWDLFIMRPDGSDKRNLTHTGLHGALMDGRLRVWPKMESRSSTSRPRNYFARWTGRESISNSFGHLMASRFADQPIIMERCGPWFGWMRPPAQSTQ